MKTVIVAIFSAIFVQSAIGQDAIQALEEIVTLRQALLDKEIALAKADRRTTVEVNQLRIDLLNAKIDLESERHDFHQVQHMLSEIQKLQEQRLTELVLMYESGTGNFKDVSEQRIQILQTRVRAARVRDHAIKAEQGDDAN